MFDTISICMQQFPVQSVFFFFLCILHLLFLQRQGADIPLKYRLYNMSQVGRTLPDPHCSFLFGIICFDQGRNRFIRTQVHLFILCQCQSGKFCRSLSSADHDGRKLFCCDFFHQESKNTAETVGFSPGKCICRTATVHAGPIAEFFRHDRRKTGQSCIDSLIQRNRSAAYRVPELCGRKCQRVCFGNCVGDEPGSSGKYFTD